MQHEPPVSQAFEELEGARGVKPVVWSVDLEECAKEYHAFAKETENCAEMGDTIDVGNAIKRYAKFMMLQNKHKEDLLVPPFDVKVVWLAHMIRVDMYRKDCEAAFGRVVDCHVLEPTFRTKASLPFTQELWKAAFGSELKYEYQPSARRVNIPAKVLDGKDFKPSLSVKDVQADRAWLPLLEGSMRNFALTDTFVSNAKRAYDMYMHLLHKHPECELGPPATVDLIWHAHMCNPLRYETDCNRMVGRVVLHNPWPPEGGTVERVESMFAAEYGAAMSEVVAGLANVSVAPKSSPNRPANPPRPAAAGGARNNPPATPPPTTTTPPTSNVKHPQKMCIIAAPDVPPMRESCEVVPPRRHPPHVKMCKIKRPSPPREPLMPLSCSAPQLPPIIARSCSIAAPRPVGNVAANIRNGICTFPVTGKRFTMQTFYACYTCGYAEGVGFCASCLTKCHRGHDVSVARNAECYCDCGAGEAPGAACQAKCLSANNARVSYEPDVVDE